MHGSFYITKSISFNQIAFLFVYDKASNYLNNSWWCKDQSNKQEIIWIAKCLQLARENMLPGQDQMQVHQQGNPYS